MQKYHNLIGQQKTSVYDQEMPQSQTNQGHLEEET